MVIGLASACAPGSDTSRPETRGQLTEIGGQVVRLEEGSAETEKICAAQFCEPNYVVSAVFGKKKPSPEPAPAPVPIPSATPTPTPSPAPITGDKSDYSRKVLKLPDAWKISEGSREVIVAVVDTGVQLDHPDLKNNLWVNERERAGIAGMDDDGDGYVDDVYGWDFVHGRANAVDDNAHGTHCAGIIGAERNGVGIVGVSPLVRIMPLKFLASDGSGDTANAIRAIDYAVANGARVISNSWGGYGRSELLNAAIQRAVAKGVLVVAAAGNDASDNDRKPFYPASYPNVVSVASSDESDGMSSFSNSGDSVTIAAPGSNIRSSVLKSKWDTMSGTSMAAPQVAGALALALAVRSAIDPSDLRDKLCRSAQPTLLNRVHCGRLDVLGLLQSVR